MAFHDGQVVLIRGGELDGVVGTVTGAHPQWCSLKIPDQTGGSGMALTTCRNEFLHAMPASHELWRTGALCAVIEMDSMAGRWFEGVVLETAAFSGVDDQALVDFGKGRALWVPFTQLRERIVIPEFDSLEQADEWAEKIRLQTSRNV